MQQINGRKKRKRTNKEEATPKKKNKKEGNSRVNVLQKTLTNKCQETKQKKERRK